MVNVLVTQVRDLNVDEVYPIVLESEMEGFRFLRRFYDEYACGTNRFDRDGETVFVARHSNQIVGISGLNRDPYSRSGSVGRIRRVYVHPDFRRCGVGRRLVSNVILEARRFYTILTLRTDNSAADQFYRAMGFLTHDAPDNATHWLSLNPDRDP